MKMSIGQAGKQEMKWEKCAGADRSGRLSSAKSRLSIKFRALLTFHEHCRLNTPMLSPLRVWTKYHPIDAIYSFSFITYKSGWSQVFALQATDHDTGKNLGQRSPDVEQPREAALMKGLFYSMDNL
jgi:hypothetical protein